jgi:hypothetical protein
VLPELARGSLRIARAVRLLAWERLISARHSESLRQFLSGQVLISEPLRLSEAAP